MDSRHIFPFLIEVSRYPLELLGIGLCIVLFRRTRQCGWLFLSAMFVATFVYLAIGMFQGSPFRLHYKKISYDGELRVESISYRVPFWQALSVTGLFLILREKRHTSA